MESNETVIQTWDRHTHTYVGKHGEYHWFLNPHSKDPYFYGVLPKDSLNPQPSNFQLTFFLNRGAAPERQAMWTSVFNWAVYLGIIKPITEYQVVFDPKTKLSKRVPRLTNGI